MSDYQISRGKIPDPSGPGVKWVWSAFTPGGDRITDRGRMFFDTSFDAIDACDEHAKQVRAAA